MTPRDTIRAALEAFIKHTSWIVSINSDPSDEWFRDFKQLCINGRSALDAMDTPSKGWQPAPEAFFDRPIRGDIVRSTLLWNYVYLQGANGDVWRVWIDIPDMQPCIELVAHNQPLPSPPMQEKKG